MIMGYGIIAVPTGIVSAEYSKAGKLHQEDSNYVHVNTQVCNNCGADKHRDDSDFCHRCGQSLLLVKDDGEEETSQ